jgi:hypothetical protein
MVRVRRKRAGQIRVLIFKAFLQVQKPGESVKQSSRLK